jgi:hypothetical protein
MSFADRPYWEWDNMKVSYNLRLKYHMISFSIMPGHNWYTIYLTTKNTRFPSQVVEQIDAGFRLPAPQVS